MARKEIKSGSEEFEMFRDFWELFKDNAIVENTEAYLRLDLVLCPARLLGLILRQGPALLRVYREQKTKKAV